MVPSERIVVILIIATVTVISAELGDVCSEQQPCGVVSGHCVRSLGCNTGKCSCLPGHHPINGSKCVPEVMFGETCSNLNSYCAYPNGVCLGNSCGCNKGHTYRNKVDGCVNSSLKVLGEICTDISECRTNNRNDTVCSTLDSPKRCQCAPGFTHEFATRTCRLPFAGEPCMPELGCHTGEFGPPLATLQPTCTLGKCVCPSNTIKITAIDDKYGKFGIWETTTLCQENYSGTRKPLGAQCSKSNECSSYYCDRCPGETDKVCRVPPVRDIFIGDYGFLGGACDDNQPCMVPGSYCSYGISADCGPGTCRCQSGHDTNGNKCNPVVKRYHGEDCGTINSACSVQNSGCVNGKCACQEGYFYRNVLDGCVSISERLIGDQCTDDSQCKGSHRREDHAECVPKPGTIGPKFCRCILGYIFDTTYRRCRLPYMGEKCEESTGCNDDIESSQTGPVLSLVLKKCSAGVCTCPSYSNMFSFLAGEKGSYLRAACQAKYDGTLKDLGAECSASNECTTHYCTNCSSSSPKRCVTPPVQIVVHDCNGGTQMFKASATIITTLLVVVTKIVL